MPPLSSSLPGPRLQPAAVAAAALLALLALAEARAQAVGELPTVTVTGRNPAASAAVTGFGDRPLAETPIQARVLTQERLEDRGVQRLADLRDIDASVSDSYNAEGYWDNLAVRGYALDQRYNYRRDGLPISGETIIPLDNKSAIELLKGTSGIQAGTSAPGGLVNYIVKRPEGRIRSLELGWRSRDTRGIALDIGERFGQGEAFGLRVNAAYEHLDPPLRHAEGHRHLLAVAGDWRLSPDTLLEAEFETSRRSQPSQPGFSLLGPRVPSPEEIDPRTNLNNQPWSLPVVMEGNTASVRLRQRLDADWRFTAHAGTQRLAMDDRLAYPFGFECFDPLYTYCDRYNDDGRFDYYAYRSDNERRRTHALDLKLDGTVRMGSLQHALTAGVLLTRHKTRTQPKLDDGTVVGIGHVNGSARTELPALELVPNTHYTERSREFYLRDAVDFAPGWTGWFGLRHTQLHRASVLTDGTEAAAYDQSITTPWLAVSHQLAPGRMVYGSWGKGIESKVTPNRTDYSTPGRVLPALDSRQFELGYKAQAGRATQWGLSYFDIRRPEVTDTGSEFFIDGISRHRGVEASVQTRLGAWSLAGSAMALHARREESADPSINGRRPANVPDFTAKAEARYRVAAVPGLQLVGAAVHEGDRKALPGGESGIPSWTRFDLGLVHVQTLDGTQLTWRAGVENATDKRAWREAPYQYGHAYLYPLAPRTWRLSVQADF